MDKYDLKIREMFFPLRYFCRFYLIKMVECYSETLGITLGQLGVDTESYGVSYVNIVRDFQQVSNFANN